MVIWLHLIYFYHRLIVTELCSGTLHDLITKPEARKQSQFLERDILREIASGLACLHDNNIQHRDLKPHNILYCIYEGSVVMKVADFECSRIVPEDRSHLTRTVTKEGHSLVLRPFGTDGWIAPEFLNGELKYTYKGDIFPLGLIFGFVLSGGNHPYGEDDPPTRNENIRKGRIILKIEQLKETDRVAFKLILSMLSVDPKMRPSTQQVLQHDYFTSSWDRKVYLNITVKKFNFY